MVSLFRKSKSSSESGQQTAPGHWPTILSQADGSHLDAVAALNVRVICELGPLVRDRSKFLELQREAMALALSIQNESYRSFALSFVDELVRNSEASGQNWLHTQGKTTLMAREAALWRQREPLENARTPLV
jgi:hypothetical protein